MDLVWQFSPNLVAKVVCQVFNFVVSLPIFTSELEDCLSKDHVGLKFNLFVSRKRPCGGIRPNEASTESNGEVRTGLWTQGLL